jgi:hypothetical protein
VSELSLQQLQAGELSAKYRGAQNLDPVIRLQISAELTEFPNEIFELADSLEILDLSNNQLTDLPNDLDRLVNLRILFLSNNNFEKIPKVVAACPKLEMISFKSNDLVEVGEEVLPLDTRWLILTDNRIETLPNSFGQLHRLQKLALAGNRLTQLPESMANCRNLELARLSANELVAMPDWLFQLPKLSWLAFSGNAFNRDQVEHNSSVVDVALSDIELGELIGEGASGLIYRARWINQPDVLQGTDKEIAVKVFKGDVTSDGYPQDELDCCLSAGKQENLIEVIAQLDQADSDNTSGIVMKLISNDFYNLGLPPSLITCTRDTFAEGTSFSAAATQRIALQMLEGLCHLHSQGISHGDIYAHNTMINRDFELLFGDFGAATNLNALSELHRGAMERVEVRAFACLLEDLYGLLNDNKDSEIKEKLNNLIQAGMSEETWRRPSFEEMKAQLEIPIKAM